jgi:phosphoribulokinase
VATNTIDAGLLAKMFLAGAKNLEVKKEWINELNVPGTGRRHRYQHDADDHVRSQGSKLAHRSEHVQPFQGNLFRFSARCQR